MKRRLGTNRLSANRKFKSKRDIVYDFIKLEILKGRLKPGERIAVAEISKIMGVSGIPIREALTKLDAEGLVAMTPHVGAHVVNIDKKKFEEIHTIRTELEGLATRLACAHLKKSDFQDLERILQETENAICSSNYKELRSLNEEFHFTIYRCCQNHSLIHMINELLNKSRFAASSLIISEDRARSSLEEHRMIIRALRMNNDELASGITKQQKKQSWDIISKIIYGEGNP